MKAFIAGFQDINTIDYPGEVAFMLFFAGCNLHCKYCYNSQILEFKKEFLKDIKDVQDAIEENLPLLDAVIFCGGEPLLQDEPLVEISKWTKRRGLKVGLETNGTRPDMLKILLELRVVDFVAMDVKAPLDRYAAVIQTDVDITQNIMQSVKILKKSVIDHEFRTTFVPGLVDLQDIHEISEIIGGDKWAWQIFRYDLGEILDKQLIGKDFSPEKKEEFESLAKQYQNVILRF